MADTRYSQQVIHQKHSGCAARTRNQETAVTAAAAAAGIDVGDDLIISDGDCARHPVRAPSISK